MAFPSSRSVATTNGTGATATPVVNLPATVAAGDTLFVVIRNAVAGAIGWPDASWNEMSDGSPDGSVGQTAFAWKKADGSEGGTTITLSSGNGKFAAVAWAIQDAADPALRAPEMSTVAVGTTGEPDATTCTPTGGAKDYFWLTFFTMEGEQTGITAYPTSHTLGQSGLANSGTAGVVTTNATIAGAGRQSNASSLDAGVWDVTGTLDDSSAWTVAFHPAEVVPTLLQQDEDSQAVPLPRARASGVSSFIAGTALCLIASVTPAAVPFAQSNWPVPAQRQKILIGVNTRPVEDPAKLGSASFELPARRSTPIALLTWLNTILREPPAAAGTPIVPPLWVVPPRKPIESATSLWWSSYYTFDDSTPFRGSVDPVPGPRAPAIGLRAWLQDKTRAAVVVDLPIRNDWPLPVARGGLRVDQLTVIGPVPPITPFAPLEWPLPTVRLFPVVARTWVQERKAFYVDATPANQTEWPLPARDTRRALTESVNLLESTLAPAPATKPVLQSDWPIQRGPAYHHALRTGLDGRRHYFTDATPANQFDWPLPPRETRRAQTFTVNLLESTLAPAPETMPFAQSDWPLPRAREAAIALRTATDTRKAFHVDLSPANQTQWQAPAREHRRVLTHVDSLLSTTLAPTAQPAPMGAAEFALPRRAGVTAIGWTQSLQQSTLAPAPAPFAQLEWPTPRGKAFPDGLRTGTDGRKPFHQDLKPAKQDDWPVPPPVKPIPRTWTQNLLESTLFVISVTPDVTVTARPFVMSVIANQIPEEIL